MEQSTPATWSDVERLIDTEGWVQLEESGWDHLIAWACGLENVRRLPSSDTSRLVRVEQTPKDGGVKRWVEPFTAHDRAVVEDSINSYLADAGIPARPVGFDWYVRVPSAFGSGRQFIDSLNRDVNNAPGMGESPRPSDWLAVMRDTIGRLRGRE